MSDIRQTLNQVLAGSKPPSEFLTAVDEYLAQPEPRLDALRSLIDAAEQLGLPAEIAADARARIPEPDVFAIGEPTRVVGSDDDRTEVTGEDDSDRTEITGAGDSDRTEITAADAPTQLRGVPGEVDSDRTEISGDADRTVVSGDADRTVQVGDGDDPFAMSAAPAGEEIGPGTVLKGRFRLEKVIGQGGMGAVYKAVDLLKVEARDRNPYMAVKLLVGDFKEHPEAFIALQRESAKAQRLAHPNIATVYDFDRDGETVYMTMELMVGAELAQYIKKLPAGGLSVPEANRIIEQLCAGLQYAHARGLVHSDFKPGNAFLLEDGSVKLLDFGIARASKTKGDVEGESTVFDPGQLGALTPAYATIEMFEGQDPDPRDDIYALACVAYELYTGKHPFNKMSAVKAKEKNLKVAPVPKLNKRQNKTLLKALALHRDDRLPSVEEFWEGLKPRKDYTLQIAGGATAAIVLVGFLAYGPIMNVFHEREHAAIIAEIDSGNDARLLAGLTQLDELPDARRRIVAERAENRILAFFRDRAERQIDHSEERYDYPAAFAEVATLDHYLPNNVTAYQMRQEFEGMRTALVNELREEFRGHLDEGRVMPDPEARDITDVLAVLKVAQPDIELLSDPRLIGAYVNRADAQSRAQRWQDANRIVSVGLEFAPRNPELLDRRDRIASELQREQEAAMIASLRDQLRGVRPQSIADFRAILEPLAQLGMLRPADPIVRGFDPALRGAIDRAIAQLAANSEWAATDALLVEFARTLPIEILVDLRIALNTQQRTAGYDFSDDPDRIADTRTRLTEIRTLLAAPTFDDAFERALTAQFKELTARANIDNGDWQAVRKEIADTYIERARVLAAEDRYVVAGTTLDQGQQFFASLPDFGTERSAIAAAETEYRAAVAERERLAAIDSQKQQFLGYVEARDVAAAAREFDALRRALPANDPFVRTEGPQALASAYLQLANQAGDNNPADALRFAEAGLQVLPGHPQLTEIQGRYRRLAAMQSVRTAAENVTTQNFVAFRRQYTDARQPLAGNEANQFETGVVTALANRLTAFDRQGNFSAANELRASALELFPGNQRLTQLQLRQPSRFAARIREAVGATQLTRADALMAEGRGVDGADHPDLRSVGEQLDARKADAMAHYRNALAEQQRGNRAGQQAALQQAVAIWSDNDQFQDMQRIFTGTVRAQRADDGSRPCTASLAGHGRVGRGECFDMVGPNQRGPALVVVPAAGGRPEFAFSKYEITIGDYNFFCQSGGGCQPVAGDDGRPVTGTTIQNADAYIAWLSETTGRQYRLPTDAEWLYAAAAGGDGRSGDNNCRVVQGGTIIKGAALTRVTAGPSNQWGVTNAVGNAQEWVRDGTTMQARGGSFQDALSNCEVGLVRPHSGGADDATGFRVMRGID